MQNIESGILFIDKAVGKTSFDVVAAVRKITGIKKAGHTGTLDPFASGLLPICLGKATRIAEFLSGEKKTYLAEIRLGIATDSGDITGKVTNEEAYPSINEENIRYAINEILNLTEQIPHRFSAVKVNGQRAYELARKGNEFELESRPIKIFSFKIEHINLPVIKYSAEVSKGTYIRVLSEKFAALLGTICTTINLRRTAINDIQLSDAVTLESLNGENWRNKVKSVQNVLNHLRKITLNSLQKDDFINGRFVSYADEDDIKDIIVSDESENLLGIGEIIDKLLKPRKVFYQRIPHE